MSGRHHHYLPQFVQRPFAYRQSGKQFYVHAYHRSRGNYTPNTQGLGQEKDFYGGPEAPALDASITDGEGALASTIQAINQGNEVSALDMATLISALAFRTKSMREALIGMFPAIILALRVRLLDNNRTRRDLMASLTDPKKSKRLIADQLSKNAGRLPREQYARAMHTLRARWKTHVAEQGEQLVADALKMTSMMLSKAYEQADEMADGAYLKALAKDPTMPIRARRMAKDLVFDVVDAPAEELFILGDCGPVAVFSDGRPRLLLGAIDDEVQLESVFLPVSPTRCIAGRLPSASANPGVAEINRMSASLSLEFFVSDRPASNELRALIGSLVPFETAQDIVEKLGKELE